MPKDFKPKTFENKEKKVTVFHGLCKGCGLCIELCPVKVISWSKDLGVYSTPSVDIDIDKCIACKICELNCPDFALKVEKQE